MKRWETLGVLVRYRKGDVTLPVNVSISFSCVVRKRASTTR